MRRTRSLVVLAKSPRPARHSHRREGPGVHHRLHRRVGELAGGGASNYLDAYNATTGALLFQVLVAGDQHLTSTTVANGSLYVGSAHVGRRGHVYAFHLP